MIKVLLITNKADVTTDFVVKRLAEQSIHFYRLNTEDLLTKNALSFNFKENQFTLSDKATGLKIDLLEIQSVYYRRPLSPDFSTESLTKGEQAFILNEITYWIEGLYKILKNAFWISPVFAIREAESKIFQLQTAQKLGFKIPDSLITNNPEEALEFIGTTSKIIKPIKTGLIDDEIGSKVIFTSVFSSSDDIERITACPTYFQDFVDKVADVRVTVVGNKVFPASILSQEFAETKVDWRNGENLKLKYEKITLPKPLEDLCVKLTKNLGLNFGAIDFVKDKNNNFIFLEINPNGQWAWIERQLDYNISQEICTLLTNEI
jgi:glutathione synthase/RimK-type ligase-like ATP-grasp enzyme